MEETETTTTYRVTLERPSRSKCPNAWAALADAERGEWLSDTFTAAHGTRITIGGNLRQATRTRPVREEVVIDETGSWGAWHGFGRLTIEEI